MAVAQDDLQDDLQARLGEQADDMGATYFGVADLSEAGDFVTDQGGDFLAEYPYALSIGAPWRTV